MHFFKYGPNLEGSNFLSIILTKKSTKCMFLTFLSVKDLLLFGLNMMVRSLCYSKKQAVNLLETKDLIYKWQFVFL